MIGRNQGHPAPPALKSARSGYIAPWVNPSWIAMLDFQVLRGLLERYGEAFNLPVRGFDIGGRPFDFNRRRALMGVINLSPDSWYTESICASSEAALRRGLALAAAGAEMVDIGAESTLPDAARVPPEAQVEALLPVVGPLSQRGVLVSVESYYPQVLEAAGQAGARVFNLTGMAEEREVLKLAKHFEATVIFCYVQGDSPRDVGSFSFAEDMIGELLDFFGERTALAQEMGVARCILDPGLGFYYHNLSDGGLRVHHQISTFLHTSRLNRLGYPTMNILPHAPEIFGEDQRRAAEPFFAVLALLAGTHVIRTHELEAVARIREVMAAYGPVPPGH
ncbi:MAG: dihydropteroate synthase [SAR324 cluster bacterium]|nr:dihydropteroate synthase [SAR324 cluster bacterium]